MNTYDARAAHAEAWRRYDGDRIIDDRTGDEVHLDDWGYADTARQAFMAGAEWQASRKPAAALSDTDREALRKALRNVLTGASVQGDSERGADAVLAAGFSRSQPVQVEVTDDMVEKAAEAIAFKDSRLWAVMDERDRRQYRAFARAALNAVTARHRGER